VLHQEKALIGNAKLKYSPTTESDSETRKCVNLRRNPGSKQKQHSYLQVGSPIS